MCHSGPFVQGLLLGLVFWGRGSLDIPNIVLVLRWLRESLSGPKSSLVKVS